jgi:hypothetical protein
MGGRAESASLMASPGASPGELCVPDAVIQVQSPGWVIVGGCMVGTECRRERLGGGARGGGGGEPGTTPKEGEG